VRSTRRTAEIDIRETGLTGPDATKPQGGGRIAADLGFLGWAVQDLNL